MEEEDVDEPALSLPLPRLSSVCTPGPPSGQRSMYRSLVIGRDRRNE